MRDGRGAAQSRAEGRARAGESRRASATSSSRSGERGGKARARELSSDARTASSAVVGAGRANLYGGRASEPVVSLDPYETEEYGTRLGRERG